MSLEQLSPSEYIFCSRTESTDVPLNGAAIPSNSKATHLGITRDNSSKYSTQEVIGEKIRTNRKTSFSLMGVGLHRDIHNCI